MNQSIKIELIGETERGDLFRLLEPLEFEWRGKSFTVPAGFESDGCSVPRFLWSSVSPRIDNRTLRGAIGHDWLYRTHPEGWTKAEADGMFYDIIREDGLSWWKSQKAYWGVRLFGGDSWHQGGRVTTKCTKGSASPDGCAGARRRMK